MKVECLFPIKAHRCLIQSVGDLLQVQSVKLSHGFRLGGGDGATFRLALGCSVLSGFRHESEFTSQGPLCRGNGLFVAVPAAWLFIHSHAVEDLAVFDEPREVEGLTSLSEITHCLQWCLPEAVVSGLLGPILLSLGFASVASVSGEYLSSRLFRWFLIPLGFALLAAIAPLAESHTCLCASDYDDARLDEVVFLAGCSVLGWLVWRYASHQVGQTAP